MVLRNHTIAASACTPSRAVIYTGQYGTKTGVTQTDGLFKNGDSPNFPWLEADGIPTLGSWLRAAGYTTHYFGKWHVSNPPEHSLKRYGFDNWEQSYPEPHGAQPNNLGVYRDAGFTDSACAFLRRQGLALNYNRAYASMAAEDPDTTGPDVDDIPPWFAVASFTNPHDIATYPGRDLPGPARSQFDHRHPIDLRAADRAGRRRGDAAAGRRHDPACRSTRSAFRRIAPGRRRPRTRSLAGKPTCQHEAAYKVGLALAAKGGFNIVNGLVSADAARRRRPCGRRRRSRCR